MSNGAPRDGERGKGVKRTPEIEVAIGARLRAHRMAIGMSQAAVAAALGITFQQVQKYEKGTDRIAASTLQVLAAVLGVHPVAFFDGDAPDPIEATPGVGASRKGNSRLQRISDPRVRRKVVELIDALADKPEA